MARRSWFLVQTGVVNCRCDISTRLLRRHSTVAADDEKEFLESHLELGSVVAAAASVTVSQLASFLMGRNVQNTNVQNTFLGRSKSGCPKSHGPMNNAGKELDRIRCNSQQNCYSQGAVTENVGG